MVVTNDDVSNSGRETDDSCRCEPAIGCAVTDLAPVVVTPTLSGALASDSTRGVVPGGKPDDFVFGHNDSSQ